MERIGRYEVISELGRGAMGVVYRALDTEIGRVVALKVVSTANASPQDVEKYKLRFHREAQAAGRLSHPGIVTIHDIAEDEGGHPYIVMEFVEGRALNLVLGPTAQVPVDRLLDIGIQVAKALDYAHQNGVVHRDIKPSNILVTPDGRAKIADFGIARLEGTDLTQEGTSLGTPSYMSPEQFRGGAIDGRSDIFSLGAVLYWMFTGKKPFPGDTVTVASFQVAYENPVPPTAAKSGLPQYLDDVLMRCLSKNPANRYQTCGNLAADLEAVKAGRPLSAPGVIEGVPAERTEPFPLPARPSSPANPVDTDAMTRVAVSSTDLGAPRLGTGAGFKGVAWIAVAFVVVLLGMVLVSKRLAQPPPSQPVAQTGAEPAAPPPSEAAGATPAPTTTPVTSGASSAAEVKGEAPAEKSASRPPSAASSKPTRAAAAPAAAKPAATVSLEVYCKHPFKQATLEVYDGEHMLLSETLEGKRRALTLGTTTGGEFDKRDISMTAGQHTFRVHVAQKEGEPAWDDTVTGTLAEGMRDRLEITFKNSDGDPGGRKLILAVRHPD